MLSILVIIIYQGFVSTIQYSANTAQYERASDDADSSIGISLSNAASNVVTPSAGTGLYLQSAAASAYSFSRALPVAAFSESPTAAINYGDANYQEDTSPASTHRHAFAFAARTCPMDANHPGQKVQLIWYKIDDTHIGLYCPVCGYETTP